MKHLACLFQMYENTIYVYPLAAGLFGGYKIFVSPFGLVKQSSRPKGKVIVLRLEAFKICYHNVPGAKRFTYAAYLLVG